MKSIILAIDTSISKQARVSLTVDGVCYEKLASPLEMKSQMVLQLAEELLKEQHVSLADITSIEVHPGPGSYTGLRVGAAIANALGSMLDIPINGKRAPVTPVYEF